MKKQDLILEIDKWCKRHTLSQTRFSLLVGIEKTQWFNTRGVYKNISHNNLELLAKFFIEQGEGYMVKLLVEYTFPVSWEKLKHVIDRNHTKPQI